MITICNIFPNNMLNKDMPRQKIELYLAHKILEEPERFAFLAKDKENNINSFKIVDNSACELGKGLPMADVIKAAEIIDAHEIVLPDLIRNNTSLAYTLENMLEVPQTCRFRLAAAIQGETYEELLQCAQQMLFLRRVATIMIPKWYCSMNSSNGLGRHQLTTDIINLMKKYNIYKSIHWLGCDTGLREVISPLAQYVRSVDSGYWSALSTEKWKNLSVTAERPRELKIDLQHMDVDVDRLNTLMKQQQQLIGEMQDV